MKEEMFDYFLILSTLHTHVICSYASSSQICPYTRQLLQAFHKNCCIVLLISSPQHFLQNFLSSTFLVLDHSFPFVFLPFSLSTWHPEFTEYWPLGLCFQISLKHSSGNQLSSHTLIVPPLPTCHLLSSLIN